MPIARPFLLGVFSLIGGTVLIVPASTVFAAESSGEISVSPELLDQLVAEAQKANPGLQAADARVQAANSAVASVRTWDDPTATLGIWAPGPGGFESSGQGNLIYGIEEKLPLFGRPELMRKVAMADASRELYAAANENQKLRRDLAVALDQLALAGREAELAKEDLAWLEATLAAVDHRYRVGQASQVDWLRAETARAMAADTLTTKEQEREHGAFVLNRLLNRDLHSTWPEIAMPALAPPIFYTPRLVDAALAEEPELKVLHEESISAQAAADLTHRSRLPDVSVGLQAWQYSGDGELKQGMATVSFSIPWFNSRKYDDEWRRDRERQRASELAADDYSLSVREILHHHIVDLDAARRQALLYRDQLIPLTRQTLASAQADWERNVGSFQDILDAHRMLVANELALAQALTDQGTILADISLLTGARDLGALLELSAEPADGHGGHLSHDISQ